MLDFARSGPVRVMPTISITEACDSRDRDGQDRPHRIRRSTPKAGGPATGTTPSPAQSGNAGLMPTVGINRRTDLRARSSIRCRSVPDSDQSRRASSRASKNARLARRGATQSPIWWNGIPRAVSPRQAGLRHGRLGDHERVGSTLVSSPVSVDWTRATPSRQPRMHDRGHAPAAGQPRTASKRAVGGAVEEAAGHDRGGRQDRRVMPGLGEGQRRPEAAPVVAVVEDEDPASDGPRPCRRARHGSRPRRAPSTPGSRSTIGSARWNPAPGRARARRDDDLVRAERGDVRPRSPSTPRRTSTPSASSRRPYQPMQVGDLAARGLESGEPELAAERRAPFEQASPRCPRSAATRAASSPAGPPPTTSTRRGSEAGSNRSPPHSNSRPPTG